MKRLILIALLAITVAGGAASAGSGDTFDSGDDLVAATQTVDMLDIENMANFELIDAIALEKAPGFLEVTGAVYALASIQLIDERTSQNMYPANLLKRRKHDPGPHVGSAPFAQLARSAPNLNSAPDVSPVNSSPLLC